MYHLSRALLSLIFCNISAIALGADTLRLNSPGGKIGLKVWMAGQVNYQLSYDGRPLLEPSVIDLLLTDRPALSKSLAIKSASVQNFAHELRSPVPEKRKIIPDRYRQLSILFSQPYELQFRLYDDGMAYRIITKFKDSITITNEVAGFNFAGQPAAYFPEIPFRDSGDMFQTSFEDLYNFKKIAEFPANSLAYTPVLVAPESLPRIAITESDLEEYPGMFLAGTGGYSLKAVFAPYPLEEEIAWGLYSQKRVKKRAGYISRTKGTRSFPWRVLIIAAEDRELPSNDLVYRLASPSRVADVSWIKPGNITDEWIIDVNLYNVPFEAGRNTASYKYYIDFAKRFGFDRIMMDAGWSDNNDLYKITPGIDMDTLLAYARQQGVKIALWTLALTLDRQLDSAMALFNKWGIDFIMTDFIDRDDQLAVGLHHRIAKACADHKIMIMFHGSYPPKGFNRTYPNAVAREAVLGSEYNIWSAKVTPSHDLILPFTRMLAGSLDYEPGMLNNANKKSFRAIEGHVMSSGTRAHQAAMLVVYDSPVQFFAGNPSQGLTEPAFMELWGSIPTTWDETRVLQAKLGEYIVTSRQHGADWYLGGMTDWSARDLTIKFDFLEPGNYTATICMDGINANRYAGDYVIKTFTVRKNNELPVHLAEGGGFLMKLQKQ